jgi:hypothetical protein
MAKKTTAVARQSDEAENLPAEIMPDYSERAGEGLEEVRASDIIIPRLTILQSLSPQTKRQKPEFIEGAEEGIICDVGLRLLYPRGVWFLPVYYVTQWLEWAPRGSDGGLKNIHTTDAILQQTALNDRRQNVLPNGNYIAETKQFFGIILNSPDKIRHKCFIPMTSTQLKTARQWVTRHKQIRWTDANGKPYEPAFRDLTYKLSTSPQTNAQGDWFGWKVEPSHPTHTAADLLKVPANEIMTEAANFYRMLRDGAARASTETMEEEAPAEHRTMPRGQEANGRRASMQDEIPM